MTSLLGIDIGTSSAKAVLFDVETAAILASAGREYAVHRPAPDRAEQDPEDWWKASIEVVRRVIAEAGRSDIAAISFSGQMHGTLLLDRANKPLAPAIIWADQRTAETSRRLAQMIGAERYTAIAGTLPAAGFMGPTLLWLAENEPKLLRKAANVILPKDYVRLKMTGRVATDVSDAAATGLFDIALKTWSPEIVAGAGLPRQILPDVVESVAVTGQLEPAAAEALGLPAGIPIVAGCADQPAQAVGNGLIAPGKASVTVGSGGQVFTPVLPAVNGTRHVVATDPRLHVFNHAVPGTWYILGAILSAGLSLRWLRDLTGLNGREDAYPMLSAEAAGVPAGAHGLIFLPYLTGERTPHMDPLARGAFIGLNSYHGRGHLARAVMEGVAFALRDALEISLSLGGQVDIVIASGGGMESDVWRQIMADVLGLPLQRSLLIEQASVGAALLGGVGAGVYADIEEACARTVRYGPLTEPDLSRHAVYNELYAQFRALYPRLREDFHMLSTFAR